MEMTKVPTHDGIPLLVESATISEGLLKLKEQGIERTSTKKNWRIAQHITFSMGERTFTFIQNLDLPAATVGPVDYTQDLWYQKVLSSANTLIAQKSVAPIIQSWAANFFQKAQSIAPDLLTAHSAPMRFVEQMCEREHISQGMLDNESRNFLEQWSKGVALTRKAQQLNVLLGLTDYPAIFNTARRLKRTITLCVGPTNSGKSHFAFETLKGAHSGVYLAPLRLLALEGYERLQGMGLPCSLLTGEERHSTPDDRFTSATVEMMNPQRTVQVGVIDEAQMILDAQRGWAWTSAICALPCEQLIIISAPEGVHAIEKLLARLGEPYRIKHFERKTELQVLPHAVNLSDVQEGDALIAFSRAQVLDYKRQLEQLGKTCSVIYGALAPEVRKAQALKFSSGQTQCLVATDAIGMGLNLPIERIIFTATEKFNGLYQDSVEHSLVRQIAGRAGRYGIKESGFVSALARNDLKYINACLTSTPPIDKDAMLQITPMESHVQKISETLGVKELHKVLIFFKNHLAKEDPLFVAASMEQMIEQATIADACLQLSILERFCYAKVPIDLGSDYQKSLLMQWVRAHQKKQHIAIPNAPWDEPLMATEQHIKALNAYRWLSFHFPNTYPHQQEATKQCEESARFIDSMLTQKAKATVKHKKR